MDIKKIMAAEQVINDEMERLLAFFEFHLLKLIPNNILFGFNYYRELLKITLIIAKSVLLKI